jgi:hypothetical protein
LPAKQKTTLLSDHWQQAQDPANQWPGCSTSADTMKAQPGMMCTQTDTQQQIIMQRQYRYRLWH